MRTTLAAFLASSALAVIPVASAQACPIGKFCGHTIIATVKQTDSAGNSSENPLRMFITP